MRYVLELRDGVYEFTNGNVIHPDNFTAEGETDIQFCPQGLCYALKIPVKLTYPQYIILTSHHEPAANRLFLQVNPPEYEGQLYRTVNIDAKQVQVVGEVGYLFDKLIPNGTWIELESVEDE